MKSVLGMGNALVDIITRLETDHLLGHFSFARGSMQLVDDIVSQLVEAKTTGLLKTLTSGGSASNTMHGLANLGIPSGYIGMVGQDEMGQFFHKDLLSNNIEPRLLFGNNPTGRAIALVSPDSERTFATFLGAAIEMLEGHLTPDIFQGYDIFYLEGYLVQNRPLFEKALRLATRRKMTVALDLSSFNVVEANRDFLINQIKKYVHILFANELEAQAITGKEPSLAIDIISEWTDIAVVKLGKEGSLVKKGTERHKIPAVPSKAIDTTGAGDLYACGFLYGLINGYNLDACSNIGSLISGRVTEIIGPKLPEKEWLQIKTLLTRFAEQAG